MLVDFEYAGQKLSDFGMSIVNFDSVNDSLNLGNEIDTSEVKAGGSDEKLPIEMKYNDSLTIELQIANISCDTSLDIIAISEDKLNKLMRWLNRKGYYVFKPIYDDGSYSDVFFKGTFNAEGIKVGESVVGLSLTFNTNAPYGFREVSPINFKFSNTDGDSSYYDNIINGLNDEIAQLEEKEQLGTITPDEGLRLLEARKELAQAISNKENGILLLEDISDNVGHVYADVDITCDEAGDLELYNELDPNNTVVIRNCGKGETIHLYGSNKIITSEYNHSALYNDFNFNFFRVCNTYNSNINAIRTNIKASIVINYNPIRKVGLIV